jgi:hypothetical protein
MNSSPVHEHLIRNLVGPLSIKKRSISKGVAMGVLLFGLFEFLPMINSNAPRIPVPWLLGLTIWIAQVAVFIKIATFLRYPRREDLFFVMAMNSDQRKELAAASMTSVHNAITPFICSSLGTGMLLEFFVFRERLIVNLLVLPAGVSIVAWLIFMISVNLLNRGFIRPSARDDRRRSGLIAFPTVLSLLIIKISKGIGFFIPHKIRPFVIRNVMYLLRNDSLQFLLFTCAAPVLLLLFMILIIKQSSSFMEFFTLLTVFVLNSYYSSTLKESSVILKRCPYYRYDSRLVLWAYFFTVAIFLFPFILVFAITVNVHLISVGGLIRMLTFLIAFAATLFISCRAILHPQRRDSETAIDFMIFILAVATGLFIPLYGWIFPLLGIVATVLLEWDTIIADTSGQTSLQ